METKNFRVYKGREIFRVYKGREIFRVYIEFYDIAFVNSER